MEEICRLCGVSKSFDKLQINLSDIYGQIRFRHYVEYYCRIKVCEDSNLPQRVCGWCIEQLQAFISFCFQVETVQSELKTSVVDIQCETIEKESEASERDKTTTSTTSDKDTDTSSFRETSSNSSTKSQEEVEDYDSEQSLLVPVKTPEMPKRRGRKQGPYSTFLKISKLYKNEINNPKTTFVNMDVDGSLVAADGEVMLPGAKRWCDYAYCCTHCKIKYESLDMILKHLRADVPHYNRGPKPWTIKCPECWSVHSRPQYVNHAVEHKNHLMFTCIICSKIYNNMTTLLNHYIKHHAFEYDSIFFCIECGFYCSDFNSLKMHKLKLHSKNIRKPLASRMSPIKRTKKSLNESIKNRIVTRRKSIATPSMSLRKQNCEKLPEKSRTPTKKALKRHSTEDKTDNGSNHKKVLQLEPAGKKPCPLNKKTPSEKGQQEEIHKEIQKPRLPEKNPKIFPKPCPLSRKPKQYINARKASNQTETNQNQVVLENQLKVLEETKAIIEDTKNIIEYKPINDEYKMVEEADDEIARIFKYSRDRSPVGQPLSEVKSDDSFPEIGKKIMQRRLVSTL